MPCGFGFLVLGRFCGSRRVEWFLLCCGVELGGWKCLGRVEWLGVCWLPGVLLAESPSGCGITLLIQNDPPGIESPSWCRFAFLIVWLMRDFGGYVGLGGWNGWGRAGEQGFCWWNHPPGTESPSGYRMTLRVRNRLPGCLGDAGFWRF